MFTLFASLVNIPTCVTCGLLIKILKRVGVEFEEVGSHLTFTLFINGWRFKRIGPYLTIHQWNGIPKTWILLDVYFLFQWMIIQESWILIHIHSLHHAIQESWILFDNHSLHQWDVIPKIWILLKVYFLLQWMTNVWHIPAVQMLFITPCSQINVVYFLNVFKL